MRTENTPKNRSDLSRFNRKVWQAGLLALAAHLIAGFFADGRTDPYYIKCATPKQAHLIIGTSRAAQGIDPSLLGGNEFSGTFYNFAFAIDRTPFGPGYTHAIESKIDRHGPWSINRLIIAVDPWSISSEFIDGAEQFPEEDWYFNDFLSVSLAPNYDYLVKHYHKGWGHLITDHLMSRNPQETYIHNDGFWEKQVPTDLQSCTYREKQMMSYYSFVLYPKREMSAVRMASLRSLIGDLQGPCAITLVRMPIGKAMYKLENMLCPDFDLRMDSLAEEFHVRYIPFQEHAHELQYVDGNHLSPEGAADFSKKLKSVLEGR